MERLLKEETGRKEAMIKLIRSMVNEHFISPTSGTGYQDSWRPVPSNTLNLSLPCCKLELDSMVESTLCTEILHLSSGVAGVIPNRLPTMKLGGVDYLPLHAGAATIPNSVLK